ncbi:MAG: beta-lactamase family protein [Bryobacterales bacterium]|nr:beta-lactamase family protein [Bryobacterales bacterium]
MSLAAIGAIAAPAQQLDRVLREAIQRNGVPAVAATVANASEILYTGAFGIRDSASRQPVTPDSIFQIASMTKAITCAAALQLVDQEKLSLDTPLSRYLPEYASPQVLDGFHSSGKPILRPAKRPITLRHLLTHTGGFAYDLWNADLRRLNLSPHKTPIPPLMTDPGTRWEYGTNIDQIGRMVEIASGQTLEAYFQKHLLGPLGMPDTSYILPEAKLPRKVRYWSRENGGPLKEDPFTPPAPPKSFNGGGGLYSTTGDYVKFMQLILRGGAPGVLSPAMVDAMSRNQTGALPAGKMKTANPGRSSDVDFHPGVDDGFTFGFLINTRAYSKGRSAGSLAWAGLYNTFYWIDPVKSLCATVMMQFLPFCDQSAMAVLRAFEEAVYAA